MVIRTFTKCRGKRLMMIEYIIVIQHGPLPDQPTFLVLDGVGFKQKTAVAKTRLNH